MKGQRCKHIVDEKRMRDDEMRICEGLMNIYRVEFEKYDA
jgi:hypothetical protein